MNKVVLVGRITRDVELRYTSDQAAVARITLAVNRRKKEDGADFISCTAWRKTAEIMDKYLHKGDQLAVSGHIRTGSYEKDGQKVYTTEVVVEEMTMLGGKKHEAKPEQNADSDGFVNVPENLEDYLPF